MRNGWFTWAYVGTRPVHSSTTYHVIPNSEFRIPYMFLLKKYGSLSIQLADYRISILAAMTVLKAFRREEFQYYADQSPAALRADLQALMKNPANWWDFPLRGKFMSEYAFKLSHELRFKGDPGLIGNTSDLEGLIFQDQQLRTRVSFSVRSNPIFAVFFFLMLLISPVFLMSPNAEGHTYTAVGFVFAVTCLAIPFGFAYFSKHNLKDDFISTFQLRPLPDEEVIHY